MRPEADEPGAFHTPVLVKQMMEVLTPVPGAVFLDATLGGAGHSRRIAAAISPGGKLIGIDRDADAIRFAETRLAPYRESISIYLVQSGFAQISEILQDIGKGVPIRLSGCLFDLGVSSFQMDHAPGFSFRRDEYLDGRMNRQGDEPTMAQLLAAATEPEISRVLWEYGEERFSRKIAKRIVEYRASGKALETTGQLARIVEESIPRAAWPKSIHPATRTWQALRIWCNDELGQLQTGLDAAIDSLAPGGRIAAISFHSLEDRIVKTTFARRSGRSPGASGYSPASLAMTQVIPELRTLTRKPVEADETEKSSNIRSRSAKLRAAERIA